MSDSTKPSQKQAFDEILEELYYIRKQLPNGELKTLILDMQGVKKDISELKKKMLDPEDGLVVRVNKNTCFREESEEVFPELVQNVRELVKWKGDNVKAVWIIFTALTGLVLNVIFNVV